MLVPIPASSMAWRRGSREEEEVEEEAKSLNLEVGRWVGSLVLWLSNALLESMGGWVGGWVGGLRRWMLMPMPASSMAWRRGSKEEA